VRAVPRLRGFYPGICLTTEEKARKNLSHGSHTYICEHGNEPSSFISVRDCVIGWETVIFWRILCSMYFV